MKLYDLVTVGDSVFLTIPTGRDVVAMLKRLCDEARFDFEDLNYKIFYGVTLTDEEEDGDEVVYRAHFNGGALLDEHGEQYSLAVYRHRHNA
jgi:hypothetical protein